MFFSLITPADGREREAAHEWANGPYAEHQWLWRLFAATEGTARDFLFRRSDVDGLPRYYAVSSRVPTQIPNAWQVKTTAYDPQLHVGDRLRFELRANPVVTHGRDGKSKRHDVVMEAKKRLLAERGFVHWKDWRSADKPPLYQLVHETCAHWLARRAERAGFSVDDQSLVVEGYTQNSEKRDRQLRFSSVDFSGELVVTDPQALAAALRDGIGHAKAFGCGLLLVRRVGN